MMSRRELFMCACVMVVISGHVTHPVTSFSISLSEDYFNKDGNLFSPEEIIDDVLHKNSLKASLGRLAPLMDRLENQPMEDDNTNIRWSPDEEWRRSKVSEENEAAQDPETVHIPQETNVSKRYFRKSRYCNLNNINARAFFEFLRTGRICGQRLSHMRFGLTGR